jgi:ABC-type phosphate/phosphonate transport system substrate-binding protein
MQHTTGEDGRTLRSGFNWHRGLALAALVLLAPLARADEFKVVIEPGYTPESVAQIYQPLLDYLGSETGHRFVLSTPRNYQFHWRDLRQNAAADFVFEEAHFTDYRTQRFNFQPLARLAERTSYSLVALPQTAELGIDGLVGKRLISMTSPSLGYALLSDMFTNPLAQPDIRSEAASWRDGVEMVFGDEADAAMVPHFIADMYPNLQVISRSRDFPGMAFSASPKVPPEVVNAVREVLLDLHNNPEAHQVLVEIGSSRFEPASAEDYRGSQDILRGFFGFK